MTASIDDDPTRESAAPEMLDDPGLSRQWVLRRIQKQLTTDLAAAAFLRGLLAAGGDRADLPVRRLADSSSERIEVLRAVIVQEGGTPYSSVGLARFLSHLAGRLAGLLGAWCWRTPVRELARHVAAELDTLVAFTRGAAGVDPGLDGRLRPLADRATADLAWVRPPENPPGVS